MKTKITFHNLQHSDLMEEHIKDKLAKIEELLGESESPRFAEVWLKAHLPIHEAEIHIKSKNINLVSHDKSNDLYVACDNAIDKMVTQVKKAKSKLADLRKDNYKRTIG
jgi:ribosomal subunit interface protein